ncbi:lactate dehydrogenase, partial [Klebsiella pneumoniae]|nr:lactate dehydrogenase [Klebsiella pneumoniae]
EFEHEGSETYLCGNPPYKGTKNQSAEQKADLLFVFSKYPGTFKVLDYVSAWFVKTAEYLSHVNGAAAFVSTNSICQGNQVPVLWPLIMGLGVRISFAYTSFKWSNLATHNAGVTVVVIGLTRSFGTKCRLFEHQGEGIVEREVDNINAYLVPNADIFINKKSDPPPG